MKIERNHCKRAYELAHQIRKGRTTLTEAARELSELGVNRNSAINLLNDLRHMFEGSRYTRAMSTAATDDFLTWIRRDDGEHALVKAVAAVSEHLDYYEAKRDVSLRSTREVLARHRALLPVAPDFFASPEEVPSTATHLEGKVHQVLVNLYERNPVARAKCIAHHGRSCAVCAFNFGKTYGDIGEGFIHVHHLKEVSSVGQEYEVDPVEDLRPVCPNCHAMLHTSRPALKIETLRQILNTGS